MLGLGNSLVTTSSIHSAILIPPCSPTDWVPTDEVSCLGWWPKSGIFTTNEANNDSVSSWVDSSGNENSLVQTTASDQPSGVLNGVVTFSDDPTGQHLHLYNSITLSNDLTIGMIINADETGGTYNYVLIGSHETTSNWIKILDEDTMQVKFSSSVKPLQLNSGVTFKNSLYLVVTKNSSNELKLYINGTLQDDTIDSGISGNLIIDSVGLRHPDGNAFKGTMSEIIVFNSESSTLTQNINDYLCSI